MGAIMMVLRRKVRSDMLRQARRTLNIFCFNCFQMTSRLIMFKTIPTDAVIRVATPDIQNLYTLI